MSSYVSSDIREIVAGRANYVCEYCLLPKKTLISDSKSNTSLVVSTAVLLRLIIWRWRVVFCNRYKGSDIASLIPARNELIRFYNPRSDRWREHFRLNGVVIVELTEIGEATIRILQMNHDDQILDRQVLNVRGRYPSEAALLLITEH